MVKTSHSDGSTSTSLNNFNYSRLTCLSIALLCGYLYVLTSPLSHSVSNYTKKNSPSYVDIPTWTLPNGVTYPTIASNTASLSASQTEAMVLKSLSLGITNIDVHLGGSERDGVAAVLKTVPRDALFLVTKIDKPPADMTDPLLAADLVRSTVATEWPLLGVDTVDVLLLKDSASCEVMQAQWAVLEDLLAEGRARALGTYNYCQFSIDCILATATIPPALNYIMRHVGMGTDYTGLITYGEARGIRTVAYGTLGEPVALEGLLTHPVINAIAKVRGRSVEEVALRWNFQAGYAISNRPTADYAPDNTPDMAVCPGGPEGDCGLALRDMRGVIEWELSRRDMARLDEVWMDEYLQSPTYYSSLGCPNSFGVVDHPNNSSCGIVDAAWCESLSLLREID